MVTMDEMVAAVKAHALANYETGGWDFCVECWSDDEIAGMLIEGRCDSIAAAIKEVGKTCSAIDEQRQEARSAGGEY
jgi:hypothetical protein